MARGVLIFIIIIMVAGTVTMAIGLKESNKPLYDAQGNEYVPPVETELTGEAWPITALTKQIPKPTTGTLEVTSLARNSTAFKLSDIQKSVYERYVISAKEKGFTNNINETGGFMGINDDGYAIIIKYNSGVMDVTITR